MTPAQLNRLLTQRRMAGRTADAVRDVVLNGAKQAQAARKHNVSRQAVSEMLKKLLTKPASDLV